MGLILTNTFELGQEGGTYLNTNTSWAYDKGFDAVRSLTLLAASALLIMLSAGICPSPAWAGYVLHKASPELYWGTIPGEKEMQYLKSLGVKTLINVRTNPLNGHARMARKLGLKFVHINTGVVLPPQGRELTEFLSLVCKPENRPTYVFCTLGTDRTCFYVAAYRVAIDG